MKEDQLYLSSGVQIDLSGHGGHSFENRKIRFSLDHHGLVIEIENEEEEYLTESILIPKDPDELADTLEVLAYTIRKFKNTHYQPTQPTRPAQPRKRWLPETLNESEILVLDYLKNNPDEITVTELVDKTKQPANLTQDQEYVHNSNIRKAARDLVYRGLIFGRKKSMDGSGRSSTMRACVSPKNESQVHETEKELRTNP